MSMIPKHNHKYIAESKKPPIFDLKNKELLTPPPPNLLKKIIHRHT